MTTISSIGVALDSPLNEPGSILVNLLSWVDQAITAFFVVEVMVKVIALGFSWTNFISTKQLECDGFYRYWDCWVFLIQSRFPV